MNEEGIPFEEFVKQSDEHRIRMKTDKRYRVEVLRGKKEKSGTNEFDLEIHVLEKELEKEKNL